MEWVARAIAVAAGDGALIALMLTRPAVGQYVVLVAGS
jgi:hypothetical protein